MSRAVTDGCNGHAGAVVAGYGRSTAGPEMSKLRGSRPASIGRGFGMAEVAEVEADGRRRTATPGLEILLRRNVSGLVTV
jgi:hypothetical protein